GLTARLDACDRDGLIEFLDGVKPAIGEYLFRADNLEADLGEEIIPGDFANAPDVIAEEVSKAGVGESFGGFAHPGGIGEKLAWFRVMLVHRAKKTLERSLVVGGSPNSQIEQNSEQFTFVVVGDAAIGQVVVRVLFEPGIEAGLLDRLGQVCRL